MQASDKNHWMCAGIGAAPRTSGFSGQITRRLLRFLWRPHGVALASVLISAFAWMLPDFGVRRGFTVKEEITIEGLLVLAAWYGLIIAMAALGFRFARLLPASPRKNAALSFSQVYIYCAISIVAWIGVGSAYYHIIGLIGLGGIALAVSRNTVNDLLMALYSDYTVGLYSLRYTSAIAGGIALFRFLSDQRLSLFDVLNAFALLGTAAISSRLSLVWAVMIGLSVWMSVGNRLRSLARLRLVLLAICIVVILWLLNYSRNAHYYAQHGTDSVIMAGIGEVQAYLGAPFQVALGVANNVDSALAGISSEYYVEWESNLNRKSAIDQLLPQMGWWSIPYVAMTAFAYSCLAGCLLKCRGTYLFLGYPVILYAFGEIWRLDFFREGIFYTNLLAAIGIPLALYFVRPHRTELDRLALRQLRG